MGLYSAVSEPMQKILCYIVEIKPGTNFIKTYSGLWISEDLVVRIRNVSHRLGYLNIRSPVGSVICGGSKEVKNVSGDSHWEVIALPHFQVTLSALCLSMESWSLSFLLWWKTAMPLSSLWNDSPSDNTNWNETSPLCCPWSRCFITAP